MSEVYIKEPATKGSAVLRTTHGDLELELWATECPKACRNFCQLILEGYYNGTIFHRVIKDFIIQGGDKTGTGDGSESVFGEPYPDEIHPRLKFRYRGMMGVASAGAGTKTNGSQFFIVMDRTPTLDRKHTLFGKIVGQTIYNLVRLTEVEVDKHDRPVDPPRIIRAELTWDPFGDLEPRFTPAPMITSRGAEKHRREAIKNKRVLSFGGGDDEESASDDDAKAPSKSFGKKAGSAHDALSDPKLLKEAAYASSSAPSKQEASRGGKDREEAPRKRAPPPKADESPEPAPSRRQGGTTAPPAKAARRKAAESESEAGGDASEGDFEKASSEAEDSSSGSDAGGGKEMDLSQKRNAEMLRLKRDIVNTRKGEEPAPVRSKPKSAWEELLSGFKTRAQRNAVKPKDKKGRLAQTEAVGKDIKGFKERVRDASDDKPADEEVAPDIKERKENAEEGSLAAVWEEGEDESTADWLSGGGLSFGVSEDKAFKLARTSKANLEIFDPLAATAPDEMLEMARLRRSAQLKPSLRRSGLAVSHTPSEW